MRFVAERLKLVIEASAGAVVAAALFHADKIKKMCPEIKKVGLVICGGNVDIDNWM